MPNTYPAGIVSDADPYFSGDTLKLVNAWSVSNHRKFTAVQVGFNRYKRSEGVIGVYRHSYVQVTQDFDVVRVAGVGAIKLTKAPEGRGPVQTWAQNRGNLRFTTKSGRTGVFHLKGDTVTLDP